MVENFSHVRLISVLALVVLSVSISGCGKRGGAMPISDNEVYYPKTYPTH